MSEFVYGARHLLASELSARQIERNMTYEKISARMQVSQAKISRILSGHVAVSWPDTLALVEILNVAEPDRTRLLDLSTAARQVSPLARRFRKANAEDLAYAEALLYAPDVRIQSGIVMPYPLRTRQYQERLMRPGPQSGDLLVHVNQLLYTTSTAISLVMDEAVLYRADTDTLDDLLERSHRFTIRVARLSMPLTYGLLTPFTIATFPGRAELDVVANWHSSLRPAVLSYDTREWADTLAAWNSLVVSEPAEFPEIVRWHRCRRTG